jgi:hypothetical protein
MFRATLCPSSGSLLNCSSKVLLMALKKHSAPWSYGKINTGEEFRHFYFSFAKAYSRCYTAYLNITFAQLL